MSTGLMPAEEVTAFYDPVRLQLTLAAKGLVQPVTEHIHFVRRPWMGGLLYELIGTTYAVMGKKQPYEKQQQESVSITPFPKDVIVKTAEHPNGKPITVFWGGLGSTTVASDSAPTSSDGHGPTTQITGPNQETIIASMGMNFTIKADASVPKAGSVNLDYNKEYLTLTTAGIQDTNIVWTFTPIKLGKTQVNLFVSGGIANYVYDITYNVSINVFDESK